MIKFLWWIECVCWEWNCWGCSYGWVVNFGRYEVCVGNIVVCDCFRGSVIGDGIEWGVIGIELFYIDVLLLSVSRWECICDWIILGGCGLVVYVYCSEGVCYLWVVILVFDMLFNVLLVKEFGIWIFGVF